MKILYLEKENQFILTGRLLSCKRPANSKKFMANFLEKLVKFFQKKLGLEEDFLRKK